MISGVLKGGLGNILFITAAIEYLGNRFGYETAYNIKEHIDFLKGDFYDYNLHADELPLIFKNFDWHINEDREPIVERIVRVPYKYEPIHSLEDNTKLVGYFQSENFWGGERDFVKELFEPSMFVNEQLSAYSHLFKGTVGAIHVRRGDYLQFPDIHPVVSLDYIDRARKKLRPSLIDKYLVFSDDLQWCRDNLKGDDLVFIETGKDYLDMFLMARCSHKIISNSSFSWFAAYLSKEGGDTISPKVWIADPKIDDSFVRPWYFEMI